MWSLTLFTKVRVSVCVSTSNLTLSLVVGLSLALEIKKSSPGTALKDFQATMKNSTFQAKLNDLKGKVEAFASKFAMPVHPDFV